MENTDAFIIVYAALLFSTVVILSMLGIDKIDVYVAFFAIEFFVASELDSPFRPSESRRRTLVGIVLLTIFAGVVIERILEILA
jgi:hypothetical protein